MLAFINNAFILPRMGGKKIYRPDEIKKGYPPGILLYPIAVFLLILIYRNHFHIAASIWAIMGFGDGGAALFGTLFGKHKLPWNPHKSYEGTISYLIFGSAGACFLCWWTALGKGMPPYSPVYSFIIVPIIVTIISAILESYPTKLDDNITIPIIGSFLMYSLFQISIPINVEAFMQDIIPAIVISAILGFTAFLLKTVDVFGLIIGIMIGVINYSFLGWKGFLLLALFFILGSLSTKLGYQNKKKKGLAEKKEGARSWTNAISKCSVGTILALFAYLAIPEYTLFFTIAFVASYAAATTDTLSSEIGQWLGKKAYSLVSFKQVPPGTEGAVSVEGTAAGITGAIFMALLSFWMNLIPLSAIPIIVFAALLSNLFESYMGIFFESEGMANKETINFLNTLCAAVFAFCMAFLL
ncbi:MAG: hypothetical protein A2Y62_06275 [Candidatus Fischerbacteria bacterium RBG_13_37_8]|uniref:TIGR00297 family protein n=1 Tax=Candidatus Fischerbacteria bacterium RBG_13_37_8 TaxID=1817863 RepID=A0A1F5VH00_9BACT|nr:MAG: hypothetical protein A2Y62_06275 [Candidatus Fischerbacteria bacterium RBG_13_37_8]